MKLKQLLTGVAVSIGAASAAHAECGEISITEMNWASASVVTNVSKFLLEQGYGCKVTVVPSSTVPAVTSVAETGEPDIVTELWLTSLPNYSDLEADGTLRTLNNVLSDGGEEGWWVPQYLVDAHPELATIDGVLANPDLVGGRFHRSPDGWGSAFTDASLATALDLEGKGIEVFVHGSGETLAASIAAAYTSEEPWFGYYWAPTSVLGQYPMVLVDMGDFNPDVHACNANPDCKDVGVSPYPSAQVITAVTPSFADENPDIAELLANISFSNAEMGAILAWQDENNASGEEAAVQFLTSNPEVWSGWLNDAAREKLSGLLK